LRCRRGPANSPELQPNMRASHLYLIDPKS
jgi:hypothetical protein